MLGNNGEATGSGIHVDVHQNESPTTPEAWVGKNASHITIKNCKIKDTGAAGGGSWMMAIRIQGRDGHHYVGYTEIYNSASSGINITEGDSTVVEYNLISGVGATGIKIIPHNGTTDSLTIRGNLLLRAQLRVGATRESKIYNNTVWQPGGDTPFRIGTYMHADPMNPTGIGSYDVENTLIANNIFSSAGNGYLYMRRQKDIDATYRCGETHYNISTPFPLYTATWKNNIYHTGNSIFLMREASATATYSGNSDYSYSNTNSDDWTITQSDFSTVWLSSDSVYSDLSTDPLFKNAYWNNAEDFGDFSLSDSSPGIGSGTIVNYWNHDYYGNAVPDGQQPDRGAIQSSSFEDNTAPTLSSAALSDQSTLVLTFSENVESSSAENTSNYSISDGISVNSASMSSNQVTLSTETHNYDQNYTITINDVNDLSGNTIASNTTGDYSISSPPEEQYVEVKTKAFLQGPFQDSSMVNELNSRGFVPLVQPYNITPWNHNIEGPDLYEANKGDFENGTESWITYGSNSLSQSTEYAHSGNY
jgi:hypothetical protein